MGNKENSEGNIGELLEELAKEREKDKQKHGERMLSSDISEDNPVEVSGIEHLNNFYSPEGMIGQASCGDLVAVRHIDSEDTHMGIYLGEFASDTITTYRPKSETMQMVNKTNPAIFVPKFGKVIFGYESWWTPVESKGQLQEITDESIQNQWYVQALQEIHGKQKEEE